jgi:glycosyltransferase involved in cell wall biosynthesis
MSESQFSDDVRHWSKEAVKRQIVGLCSGGLAGGAAQADYLAMLGMPRKRILTGYDVIDNAYFARHAEAARQQGEALRVELKLPEKYFLASNRFIEKKNLFRLLEAFAGYRLAAGKNAWKLVLMGDGPLKEDLLKQRDRLELTEDVFMPGFRQYKELPIYYGLASAFVHASTVEQWGLVVNEAMASGLPVLVSERCGCARDLVVNGRNGFTFDPLDVPGLSQRMLRMSDGALDLKLMAQQSHEIISRWSPQTFASNLQAAVEKAKTEPSPKAGFLNQLVLKTLLNSRLPSRKNPHLV